MSNATPTLTTESPPLCQPEAALAVPRKRVPFRTREKKSDVCRMRFLVCVLGGYRQDHRDVHSLMGWSQLTPWRVLGLFQKQHPPGVSGQPQEHRRPALVEGTLGARVIS